jgi:hypothetical protein
MNRDDHDKHLSQQMNVIAGCRRRLPPLDDHENNCKQKRCRSISSHANRALTRLVLGRCVAIKIVADFINLPTMLRGGLVERRSFRSALRLQHQTLAFERDR